jgi:hypothetical protein
MDMNLLIFTDFNEALMGESWENVSKEDVFEYSIVF